MMRGNATKLLAGCAGLILLAACNKPPESEASANTLASAETAKAKAEAATANAATREKEAELAKREAELAAREANAAAAAARSAGRPASRPAPGRPAPSNLPVVNAPVTTSPVAAPSVLVVPAGTQLSLALVTALSSKTAKVGDVVRAGVMQDVRVNDRVAIASGTTVAGTVTDVVSGSSKIGGIPTLGLRFERLEMPGNVDVPIDGVLMEKGKSDTGRDTAKIVGGAAAGAILGHQVKGGDKGKVLGGLLGGAIGAVAAQKTGTEVTLAEGTAFTIALAAPVEITKR
ncbi:MAG: glycine zipper 2TM domain-containing protein [Pseudomonadota bacterium]